MLNDYITRGICEQSWEEEGRGGGGGWKTAKRDLAAGELAEKKVA